MRLSNFMKLYQSIFRCWENSLLEGTAYFSNLRFRENLSQLRLMVPCYANRTFKRSVDCQSLLLNLLCAYPSGIFHVNILTSSIWGLGDISQVMYVLRYRWLGVQCMSSLLCWQDSSILTSLWVEKSIQNLKSCGTFRNFLVIFLFWGF